MTLAVTSHGKVESDVGNKSVPANLNFLAITAVASERAAALARVSQYL